MLEKFTFPHMRLFYGSSDPDDHIAHYKQRMFVVSIPQNQREACMCKDFRFSLAGPALQWYTSLPNSSIGFFTDLHLAILEQFSSSQKIKKHPGDIYAIKQRDSESLRVFVARFNKEKVSIPGCDMDTTISSFCKGLRSDSDL